jgi:hypothetical protein
VSPPRHPNLPIPAEADKSRLVCQYSGLQIFDARERIQVVLADPQPVGIRACLRHEGFKLRGSGIWEAPATPMSITAAQAIGHEFFGEQTP